MVGYVGIAGLALLYIGAGGGAMTAKPVPVHCTVTGAKYFAPALSATEVCARFARALRAVSVATPPRDGLVVELRFLPRGMANARAMRLRAGQALPLPVYELAISDRQFTIGDIDTLAVDVARGLKTAASGKGRG